MEAEERFCEMKSLNVQTLRMTWEAKNQLRDIMIGAGFPETCLMPMMLSSQGPDSKLDLVNFLGRHG